MPQTCCVPGCDTGNRSEVKALKPDEKIYCLNSLKEKIEENNGLVGCPVKTGMFQKIPIYSCVKSIFTKIILKQVIVMQRGNTKLGKSAKGKLLNPTHCQACVLISRHCLPLVSQEKSMRKTKWKRK